MWRFVCHHEGKMLSDPFHLKHEGGGFFTSSRYPGVWHVYTNRNHYYVTRFIDYMDEETSIWSPDGDFVTMYLTV
jgi:hypothetical protein